MRAWVRDRSLGLLFVGLFLITWIGQLVAEWQDFVNEQQDHGASATFWSGDFWSAFWQSTLENWQSEFLQLAAFTIGAAYLVYKGSSESPDGDERVEAKLDALLKERGIDPDRVVEQLPLKFHKQIGVVGSERLEDLTLEQLRELARRRQIEQRSTMNKQQLIEALRRDSGS